MKIKIKKDCQLPENVGWCFMDSGYDKNLIKQINSGKAVQVDRIHPKAYELVTEIKKKKDK